MALWGFGRGHARLNPAPAGWHRGEREVTAPQHTAHKTLRVVGERRERIGLKNTNPGASPGQWGGADHTYGSSMHRHTQTSCIC